MSTKPQVVYDYLQAKCETLWPEKKQLFNPYTIEHNNELRLMDGFGIGFGAFTDVPKAGCCFGMAQDYVITISKKFYALENDSDKRMDFEQELMGEAVDLLQNITQDANLAGNVSKCVFTGSPGVQQVFSESQQFVFVSLTFNAEFTVNL